MKRIATAILLGIALLALGLFLYSGSWHPSDRHYPVQGIDVSHHQGPIQWDQLPEQGVDFAYIKATEGGDFRDRLFEINWREAGEAGIARGAYHFFTLCRSGADQAANFAATVPVDAKALPPVVDLEFLGNCSNKISGEKFSAELRDFLIRIEAHSGKRAVLYLTQEFDQQYRVSASFQNPLWLRSLVFQPRFGSRPWTIWQVSNFRRLRGIEGRVDWNVSRLDLNDLALPLPNKQQ